MEGSENVAANITRPSRGFSINKQVEADNLTEEAVVAKRTICDYINYIGGISNVDVSNKKLILAAAAAARQKYSAYLTQKQKDGVDEEQSKKRKAVQDQLEQLTHPRPRPNLLHN